MHTLHLVYAGNPNGHNTTAPYTITQNLYRELSKHYKINYYDWCHTGNPSPISKSDIILGHPNYPDNTATRRLFQMARDVDCPNKFLIFPFHHALPHINLPFTDLVEQAKHVFSITGPYWYDTIPQNSFPAWKPKMTRIDMAIDPKHYPFVRTKWPNAGQRHFAYIGSDRPEKGIHLLYDIFQKVDHILRVYGSFDGSNPLFTLPNVRYHGYAHTTPQFASDLLTDAVAFLNPSVSDANPTTLLEAISWGLIVAATPQSGYYDDDRCYNAFWRLSPDNINDNIWLLNYLQQLDDDSLWRQARHARKVAETHYTWEKFTSTIITKLTELIE